MLHAVCVCVATYTPQYGFLHHIRTVIEEAGLAVVDDAARQHYILHYPPRHVFAVCFVTVFSVVIALFKDLPDLEGDKRHGVRTYGTP